MIGIYNGTAWLIFYWLEVEEVNYPRLKSVGFLVENKVNNNVSIRHVPCAADLIFGALFILKPSKQEGVGDYRD